ncbi:hypothetical protein SeMB42_g01821 [Synchytrium endobioticum]|uniref:t-SNARE coiled-coil homology domain-containing protein n=1 Tax=Synchytrium endobioticum TaxID=286115 RepID=A0A507DCQ5_9FUNG|nr:hypothetical protein SeLEV6574_g01522 [Synchytrium endobioticum]TPX51785.1 hypothetical protein SeMB42_g01821 [Synchytrium endobioticum]
MSDIEEFAEEIEYLLEAITTALTTEVPKLRGIERLDKCSNLKNRLTRARQAHRSILIEIRDLSADSAAKWNERATEYANRMTKFQQDIEWAEKSADQENMIKPKTIEQMTAREVTTQALQVQEESLAATNRTRAVVEQTIQMGGTINEELKRQTEQIQNIDADVDQVENNLKRADKQLRVLIRRMATDKIFILMILLVVVGILLAIVSVVLKKYTGFGGGSSASPSPTP